MVWLCRARAPVNVVPFHSAVITQGVSEAVRLAVLVGWVGLGFDDLRAYLRLVGE